MPSYRVEWSIDIDADSPWEAAEKALFIQRDWKSTATVFVVQEHDAEDSVTIDLLSENEEE